MRAVLSVLIVVLLVLLVGLAGLAILLGWSIGWGSVLMRWLPFSLFEASLLTLVGTVVVGGGIWRVLSIRVPNPDWMDEEEEEEDYPIHEARFLDGAPGKTGETVFRYELANDLFLYIRDNAKVRGLLGEKQLEELAIRLTDVLVAVWKNKRIQGYRVNVSVEAMKKQMEKMGQRPYDDPILQAAVFCVNQRLSFDEELKDIVVEKRWDEVWDL